MCAYLSAWEQVIVESAVRNVKGCECSAVICSVILTFAEANLEGLSQQICKQSYMPMAITRPVVYIQDVQAPAVVCEVREAFEAHGTQFGTA